MKVEIDSEELKRLRSREEKYLAYMNMLSYRGEDKTYVDALCGKVAQLEKENIKLKEFKTKREENMFYFKALLERAKPKTAREAEDLQKAKELFEKLYMEKLSYLEEENKKLQSDLETVAGAYFDK